ncbi:MAG: MaoC family dehydratase [bacterium]|nr:MaoC family dehydratase [bacterium]
MKQLTLADTLDVKDLDLGESRWFLVDQERINGFAAATEDHQWIHVDEERAKQTEIGTTIAHGYLMMSLLPNLFFELVKFTDMGMMINFGLDKVRFIAPVPSGSEVQLRAKLISARKRLRGVLMRIRGEMFLRSTGRRCLSTEVLFLAFTAKSGEETD